MLDSVDNKDASFFPEMIPNPFGRPAIGLVHRPVFPRTPRKGEKPGSGPGATEESIWISYCHLSGKGKVQRLNEFVGHHRLTRCVADWERVKIGGGAPPILCRHGWPMLYHGVHQISDTVAASADQPIRRRNRYSAGAMVLSHEHPNQVLYRTPEPVLVPDGPHELYGTVDNVVFPTGIDRRDDLGMPNRFDIYYGMADNRIGAARLDIPEVLPSHAPKGVSTRSRKRDALDTGSFPADLRPVDTAVRSQPAAEA